MKIGTKKGILLGVIIALLLAIVVSLSVTIAYLSSRRQVEGYIHFANGILVTYENVEPERYTGDGDIGGNLLCQGADGRSTHLALEDVEPGDTIKLLNPKLTVQEGSRSFALRIRIRVTDETNPGDKKEYQSNTEISQFLRQVVGTGALGVDETIWKYQTSDNYYYYTNGATLKEITDQTNGSNNPLYLFKGDQDNEGQVTLTLINEVEELTITQIKFELWIEAVSFDAASDVWGFQG